MTTPTPYTPRLFADYAASPSRAERRAFRAWHRTQQLALSLDDLDRIASSCPVCSSADHDAEACPHGAALTLTLADDVDPDDYAATIEISDQLNDRRTTP